MQFIEPHAFRYTMRSYLAWSRVDPCHTFPSGVTSKPAIEGHFKTGQRTITLDEPFLPYWLAIWQGQFDPARHSAKPDSSLPLHPPAGEFRRSNQSFLF